MTVLERYACRLLLLLACSLVGLTSTQAQEQEQPLHVVAVKFEGNKQTQAEILLQELTFDIGGQVPQREIERSRQAIMDLGLFKRVTTSQAEVPGGTEVTYIVEEKFYFLPIPLLGGDPYRGEWEYGLDLRMDNFQGLNQRVQIGYQSTQSTNGETSLRRKIKASYLYPRLLGSPYQFSTAVAKETEDVDAQNTAGTTLARYRQDTFNFGVGLSRWFNKEGPSIGWRGGIGLLYANRAFGLVSGQAGLLQDSQAISITTSLGLNEVHDYGYFRTGHAYGWIGELGLPFLGSDYRFNRNLFYFRNYRHREKNDSNLNTQVRIGLADGHVFGEDTYNIGGFLTLRGYKTSLTGNAIAIANMEYLQQLDGWPSVRGVAFLDVGNAYSEIRSMDLGKLEAGTGIGARWRVQSLVDVIVTCDIAYGIGPGETVIYLGTSGTF